MKRRRVRSAAPVEAMTGGVEWREPDPASWLNPFNQPDLLDYFDDLAAWHGYIRFLGLPHLEDNPDVPIERLFVPPAVTAQAIRPEQDPASWPDTESLLDALTDHPRLVLLGDPGSGKSTVVSWIAWQLGREPDGPFRRRLGPLVPLPMTLRELRLDEAITWDGLLEEFLARPLAARLRPERLRDLLSRGQALVLLDGIDEIGSAAVRTALRDAVLAGAAAHPSLRWLSTSRAVGYDAVPFHRIGSDPERQLGEPELPPDVRERGASWADLRWLAPFDDGRIERFARGWYARHEAPRAEAERRAEDLIGAVRFHPDARTLARTPVFLTLMALIHRIQARLPHGRAVLYSKIVEAYLESIDRFRGIEEVGFSLEEKRRWLAEVAFRMQRRRDEAADEPGAGRREILITEEELIRWLAEAMAASPLASGGAEGSRATARTFVGYVARRSGLLLPRGVDPEGREVYAFTHLSFQEFFAALHLHGRIHSFRWGVSSVSTPAGDGPEDLKRYADQERWQETLAFLFGLLTGEPDWAQAMVELLFGEGLGDLFDEGKPHRRAAAVLLARIAVDPHAGLPGPLRREAWTTSWRWHLRSQPKEWTDLEFRIIDRRVAAALLSAGEQDAPEVLGHLAKVWDEEGSTVLCLRSAVGLHSVGPIVHLPGLLGLNLSGTALAAVDALDQCEKLEALFLTATQVHDLEPLANLQNLQHLDLDGTQVHDLEPLANLQNLQYLSLSGTQVLDLEPLANLQNLQYLSLSGTQVLDLVLLANLQNLRSLDLSGTQILDLIPLANLQNLRSLDLSATQILDLVPLANLQNLQYLSLSGTKVHDLAPLANLQNLQYLLLSGTQVHDLEPLANLQNLQYLFLSGTQVHDLEPLANLQDLQYLSLSGTKVHDLGPLEGKPELNVVGFALQSRNEGRLAGATR